MHHFLFFSFLQSFALQFLFFIHLSVSINGFFFFFSIKKMNFYAAHVWLSEWLTHPAEMKNYWSTNILSAMRWNIYLSGQWQVFAMKFSFPWHKHFASNEKCARLEKSPRMWNRSVLLRLAFSKKKRRLIFFFVQLLSIWSKKMGKKMLSEK